MTRRQKELLGWILDFVKQHGMPPTYDEMAKGLGVKSRGNTHRMVKTLVDEGYLSYVPGKFRTVKVTSVRKARSASK